MDNQKTGIVPKLVIVALSLGVIIALFTIGKRDLTSTESLLLGILLSAASMMVSWLATHIYSQRNLSETVKQATETNTENIKNYAVKAAEKVLNLSNQLQRLIDAMSNAIDDSSDTSDYKESSALLQERISSAIHNLETLKSMNDTFLSDWRGVIGEEIDRQQILENQIEKLSDELEQHQRERELLKAKLVSPDDLIAVEKLISETEKRLRQTLIDLPFKVSVSHRKTRRRDIVVNCPSCSTPVETRFRLRKGAKKLIKCIDCDSFFQLYAISDNELDISSVPLIAFHGKCPTCNEEFDEQLPDYPSATKGITCVSCDSRLMISRTRTDFNVRTVRASKDKFPKELIEDVKSRLPENRPWPKHIHKQIASDLGISNSLTSRIITSLINKGLYPLQDGIDVNS